MSEERLFKKTFLGGFNREDVMAYIDELLTELKKAEEENERMASRISELERKLDEYEAQAAVLAAKPSGDAEVLDNPADVLSQVDRILQSYLNKEE